jgi:rhodanese-related sulfurtransferase
VVDIPAPKHHSPGFLAIVEDAKERIREISVEDTQAAMKNGSARLIDVREDHEWEPAHIAGAEHLGKGIIERDIETFEPDKSAELILYCGGGFRAALVADVLQKMGYTNVKSMAGGWRAWLVAGGPIEEEEP